MLRQLEGSRAVAETVARCRPEVIAAYPISPQTHIVEALSDKVRTGELSPCEYVSVESEFAAMSVAVGASAAGARPYTATASQGLLYMAEALYNASGLGLPIVMTLANRAIGAGNDASTLAFRHFLDGELQLRGIAPVQSAMQAATAAAASADRGGPAIAPSSTTAISRARGWTAARPSAMRTAIRWAVPSSHSRVSAPMRSRPNATPSRSERTCRWS